MYKRTIFPIVCVLLLVTTSSLTYGSTKTLWAKTYEIESRTAEFIGLTPDDNLVYVTTPTSSSKPAYLLTLNKNGDIKANVSLGVSDPVINAIDKNGIIYLFKHSNTYVPYLYAIDELGNKKEIWDLSGLISMYYDLVVTKSSAFYIRNNITEEGATLYHTITKINPDDLSMQWSITFNKTSVNDYDPFLISISQHDEIVFFLYEYFLYAVDADNGNVLWHKTFPLKPWWKVYALPDNKVAIFTKNDYEHITLYLLNEHGEELWNTKIVPYYSGQTIVSIDLDGGSLGVTRYDYNTYTINKYEYNVYDVNNGELIGNFSITKDYSNVNQKHVGILYKSKGYYESNIYEVANGVVLTVRKLEFSYNAATIDPLSNMILTALTLSAIYTLLKKRKMHSVNT